MPSLFLSDYFSSLEINDYLYLLPALGMGFYADHRKMTNAKPN